MEKSVGFDISFQMVTVPERKTQKPTQTFEHHTSHSTSRTSPESPEERGSGVCNVFRLYGWSCF